MTKYARVIEGSVFELFDLPVGVEIADCFHPGIPGKWVDCTSTPDISHGWQYDGSAFHPPEHQE
jgi:hypothetical protein